MTDRPMDASATEHPDEGLIHAWLDDGLGAAEGDRIAAHVSGCAACQARVAEARGLIAGASRIVAVLDDAPAGTRPGWAQTARLDTGSVGGGAPVGSPVDPVPQRSLWRWLRVTPARAALAATILVAIGITLTHDRVSEDSVRSATSAFDAARSDVPATTPAEGGAADGAKEARTRDALLDSAVAGNVARTQGRAKIEAAPGPALPQAPPRSASADLPVGAGAARVARGRAVDEAERETAGVAADRLRVGNPVGAVATTGNAAGAAADPSTEPAIRAQTRIPTPPAPEDAMMAARRPDAVAASCLRIDSQDADARWADQPFPLVLAVDSGSSSGPRNASVLTAAGQPTELRATWRPREGDSISITLRRIGYSGSIALGPDQAGRSGVARSAAAPTAFQEEVVAVAPTAQARGGGGGGGGGGGEGGGGASYG
jgi:hypothetical protein